MSEHSEALATAAVGPCVDGAWDLCGLALKASGRYSARRRECRNTRAQVGAGDVVDAIEGPGVRRGGTQQAQVANDGSGAWFGRGGYGRVRAVMTSEIALVRRL